MQRRGEAATHLRCRRPGFCSLQCLALLLWPWERYTAFLWLDSPFVSWRGHNCYSSDVVRINAVKSVKCSREMVTGAGSRVRLSFCKTTMGKIHCCLLEAQWSVFTVSVFCTTSKRALQPPAEAGSIIILIALVGNWVMERLRAVARSGERHWEEKWETNGSCLAFKLLEHADNNSSWTHLNCVSGDKYLCSKPSCALQSLHFC